MNPGLSPLARGTRRCHCRRRRDARFIPAGAGNTLCAECANDDGAVYPRWRREHFSERKGSPGRDGLSPLARGTPSGNVPGSTGRRFIPAGAGNTRSPHARHFIRAVYPRWRGEHCTIMGNSLPLDGLSPLARGTRRINSQVQRPPRFIPAGAGNTKHFQQ